MRITKSNPNRAAFVFRHFCTGFGTFVQDLVLLYDCHQHKSLPSAQKSRFCQLSQVETAFEKLMGSYLPKFNQNRKTYILAFVARPWHFCRTRIGTKFIFFESRPVETGCTIQMQVCTKFHLDNFHFWHLWRGFGTFVVPPLAQMC